MRNYLRWLIVLTLIVALLATFSLGCDDEEEGASPTPAEATPTAVTSPTEAPKSTYKIGAVFSVTGPYSPLGEPEKQTVEMMIEEINTAGGINGHPVEIIVYDDESETTKAATMATRLIEQDEVLAIVGPTASGTSMAMVPVATDAQIPMVACAASEPIVNDEEGKEREWTFMTPQSSNQAARTIYKYMRDTLGISDIAILPDIGGFGQMGKDALELEATGSDINIVASDSFDNRNDTDMTPQLINLMNASPTPEAIVCWGTNPGPAIITTNWADQEIEVPLFQSHGSLSQTFLDLTVDAAEGVMLPSGKFWIASQLPDTDPQKSVLLDYIADFEAKYGEGKTNTYGGHAYDALSMVIMALEEMDDNVTIQEARTHIRDYIQTIQDFAGTGGVFNYSEDNHHGLTDDAMVMVKVMDGKFTWLKP